MPSSNKILIVDDDADFAEAVSSFLEANGYQVLQAHDGSEGLKLAKMERPGPDPHGHRDEREDRGLLHDSGDPRTRRDWKTLPIFVLSSLYSQVPGFRSHARGELAGARRVFCQAGRPARSCWRRSAQRLGARPGQGGGAMKILKLPKEKLDFFASVVQQFGEVHAPVEQNGKYVFKRLTRWSDARLDYDRTILPPKKYFLPPRETLFQYRPGEGYVPVHRGAATSASSCSACTPATSTRSTSWTGSSHGKYDDPYYQTRRKNIAIIGIDCTPDEHCFCRSMRADFVDHGFDLFFYDIGDYYQVLVGTALGRRHGAGHRPAVRAGDAGGHRRVQAALLRTSGAPSSSKSRSATCPRSSRWSTRARSGTSLGERCLSCGSCSMVCPTCYCYDVADDVELGSRAGKRSRSWDSCLFCHPRAGGGRRELPRAARQPHQVPLTTTSSAASWPNTAGRVAWAAAAASPPAR